MMTRILTLVVLFWVILCIGPEKSGAAAEKLECSTLLHMERITETRNYLALFPKDSEGTKSGVNEVITLSRASLTDAQKAEQYLQWLQGQYPNAIHPSELDFLTDVLELSFPMYKTLLQVFTDLENPEPLMSAFADTALQMSLLDKPERFVRTKGTFRPGIHQSHEDLAFGHGVIEKNTELRKTISDIISQIRSTKTWGEYIYAVNLVRAEMIKNKKVSMVTVYREVGRVMNQVDGTLGNFRYQLYTSEEALTALVTDLQSTLALGKEKMTVLNQQISVASSNHVLFKLEEQKNMLESQLSLISGFTLQMTRYGAMIEQALTTLQRLEGIFSRIHSLMKLDQIGRQQITEKDELYKAMTSFQNELL